MPGPHILAMGTVASLVSSETYLKTLVNDEMWEPCSFKHEIISYCNTIIPNFYGYGLWSVNHGCLTHIRPLRDSESEASLISYGFSMGFGAFMVRRVIRFFAEGWENEVALVHGNLNPTYVCTIFHSQYESFMSIYYCGKSWRYIIYIHFYAHLRFFTVSDHRLYICACIIQRLSLPIPNPFGPLTCEVEEAKEGFARSQLEEESGSPEGSVDLGWHQKKM